MKFKFLQKQTSRREMLRGSATLAGGAFLAHLFPAKLLRASAAGYAESAPSPAVLLASMRAKFNAVPMETQKLADNVTMFDGPGGAVTVLNGPDGKFVVDTFVAPAWPRLKEALDGLGNAPLIRFRSVRRRAETGEIERILFSRIHQESRAWCLDSRNVVVHRPETSRCGTGAAVICHSSGDMTRWRRLLIDLFAPRMPGFPHQR